MTRRQSDRAALKWYAEAISLWNARLDTAEIAARIELPEGIVARWVANFRDQVCAMQAVPMPVAKAA